MHVFDYQIKMSGETSWILSEILDLLAKWMSLSLVLFDEDGFTTVVDTCRVGVDVKKVRYAYQEWPHPADTASPHSQKVERRRQHVVTYPFTIEGERCTLYIGGKKYLVEILKIADNREDLDAFERGWANSSRGSVIDMRKELLDGKKGGYLDCKPLQKMTTTLAGPVVKLLPMNLNTICNVTPKQITSVNLPKEQKSLSMRLKKPIKKVLKKATDCVKGVKIATRHLQKKTVYDECQNATPRSRVHRDGNINVPDSESRQAKPRSGGSKEGNNLVPDSVSRRAMPTSSGDKDGNTSVPDSESNQANVVMPNSVPRSGSKRKPRTVITGGSKRLKLATSEEYPKLLDSKKLPKKIGNNKRELTVLFEGDMDSSSMNQEPRRQPVMTDHLTQDQADCVIQQVELFAKNKVNVSVQTDAVLVFQFDKEVQDFERNKKYLEIFETVSKIYEAKKNMSCPSSNKLKTPQKTLNLSEQRCISVPVPSMTLCYQQQPLNLTVKQINQQPPNPNSQFRQQLASLQRQCATPPNSNDMQPCNSHPVPSKNMSNQQQPLNLTVKPRSQEPPIPNCQPSNQQPASVQRKCASPPNSNDMQPCYSHPVPRKNLSNQQQPLNLTVKPKSQKPPIPNCQPSNQQPASVQRQCASPPNHVHMQPVNCSPNFNNNSPNTNMDNVQANISNDDQFTDNSGGSFLEDLLTECDILPPTNDNEYSATPYFPAQPLQTISTNTLSQICSSETLKRLESTNFPTRPLFEISCCKDILSIPKEANVTINKDLRNDTRIKHGHSPSSFGWQLARALYSDEELEGKNFNGRGKAPLSPRRRDAIKHCIESCYPEQKDIQTFIDGINAGIRNLRRKKLSTLRLEF